MDWEVVALLDIPEKIIELPSMSDLVIFIMNMFIIILITVIISTRRVANVLSGR